MLPINLRHTLFSSSFLSRVTSNSCIKHGRSSLGSDLMAPKYWISDSYTESPEGWAATRWPSTTFVNFLILISFCRPAGRRCSLFPHKIPSSWRELRSWRASSCSFVKRSSLPLNLIQSGEHRREKAADGLSKESCVVPRLHKYTRFMDLHIGQRYHTRPWYGTFACM